MAATFVVEDGNGLPTANAYVSLQYADDYFASRGVSAWAAAGDPAQQTAIVRATDYIETVWGPRFIGNPAFGSTGDPTVDQALSFPRDLRTVYVGNTDYSLVGAIYSAPAFVTNPLTKPVVIPASLLKATCEYALRALTAGLLSDPTVDPSGLQVASRTESVGPITETIALYNVGGIQVTQPYPAADLLIKPLIMTGGSTTRG